MLTATRLTENALTDSRWLSELLVPCKALLLAPGSSLRPSGSKPTSPGRPDFLFGRSAIPPATDLRRDMGMTASVPFERCGRYGRQAGRECNYPNLALLE